MLLVILKPYVSWRVAMYLFDWDRRQIRVEEVCQTEFALNFFRELMCLVCAVFWAKVDPLLVTVVAVVLLKALAAGSMPF